MFSVGICTHLDLLLLDETLPVGSLCKVARNHNRYRERAQKQHWAKSQIALKWKNKKEGSVMDGRKQQKQRM